MSHVLIVGANSDIAKACARVYASCGHDLVLAVRDKGQVIDLIKDVKIRYDCQVSAVELNVVEYQKHAEFYQSISSDIEGVIVAAGYMGEQSQVQNCPDETMKTINTNLTGVVQLLNIIANDFEQRGHGFMVVLSSVAGDRGRQKNYIYGAAKAGLTAYLSGLRNRLFKSGVRVLTVKPGFVATKMTQHLDLPERLTAKPQDIAHAIQQAQKRGKDVLYYPKKWRLIMAIIRAIPEKLFKRLDL